MRVASELTFHKHGGTPTLGQLFSLGWNFPPWREGNRKVFLVFFGRHATMQLCYRHPLGWIQSWPNVKLDWTLCLCCTNQEAPFWAGRYLSTSFLPWTVSNKLSTHSALKNVSVLQVRSRSAGISRASFYRHREEGTERLCDFPELDGMARGFVLFFSPSSSTPDYFSPLQPGQQRQCQAQVSALVYRLGQGEPLYSHQWKLSIV